MMLFICLILVVQSIYVIYTASSARVLPQLMCFLASIATAEFSKRFLYVFGDVPHFCYYLMLVPPDLIFFTMVIRQKGQFIFNKSYIAVGMLFIGYSLFLNTVSSVALNLKTEYMYTIIVIAPVAFWGVRDRDLRIFRKTVYALAVAASIYGLYQFVFGYPRWETRWFEKSPTEMDLGGFTNWGTIFRAFSFFSGLHEFALFLCFASAFFGFTSIRSRVWKCGAFAPLMVGLFVSNAKGVYVAVLISAVLLLLRSRLSATRIMLVLLAPVAFFFLASELAINSIIDYVSAHYGILAQYINPGTSIPRLIIFTQFFASLDIHSIEFYFGRGIGSVITTSGTAMILDNNYLQILSECGLAGLLCFLVLVYFVYREYFWLINNVALGRMERGIVDAAFFYITTVLFDLYGSVDLATRGVLLCFVVSCMLIHTQYKRCLKLLLCETEVPVTRSRYAST